MYENGHGVQEDLAQAFQWYLKAAKQGNAVAQCLLAMMLEESDGDSQDVAMAAEWYLKAAKQGHPESQYRLGRMFCLGIGGQEESADRHQLAAEKPPMPAMRRLLMS